MRLVIVGTGGMARAHAKNFSTIDGVEIVGAVDVDAEKLAAFCKTYKIKKHFTTLADALEWGQFDAVANVTPDAIHYPTTMPLLHAGKHVFCEKPLAQNHAHAQEMTEAADAAGVVAMVNLTYRNVAEIHKARELVESGAIGQVKHVEASYLQSWLVQDAWGKWDEEDQWLWRLSTAHGSNGTLGDIGIHILDFIMFGANQDVSNMYCRLHTFDKAPGNKIREYTLDANDSFAMSVQLNNGAIGTISASRFASGHLNDLTARIYGDKGGIEVSHTPNKSSIRVCLGRDLTIGKWKKLEATPVVTNYQRFADAVMHSGYTTEPSFAHATRLQMALDLGVVSDESGTDQTI